MEKLVPPNIFILKKEEVRNMVVKSEEFYSALLKKIREKPGFYTLNMPETVVKGFGVDIEFLVHVDDGVLVYTEDVNDSTFRKFLRRCSFHRIASNPVCVCKTLTKSGKFESIVLNSLTEAEIYWNNNNSVVIQRFIACKSEILMKARIYYTVTKETFVGKILWKDRDDQFKLGKDDLVNEDEIRVSKFFKQQLRNLKEILEPGAGKIEISEMAADFLQDLKGNWFFIDIFYVKLDKKRYKAVSVKKVDQTMGDLNESYVSDSQVNSLQLELIKDFEDMLKPKKKQGAKSSKKKVLKK